MPGPACRDVGQISEDFVPPAHREKRAVFMEKAGGGGASTLGLVRNDEDSCFKDFKRRLWFLLDVLKPKSARQPIELGVSVCEQA